ncbi:MAG: hypothetical protein JOZ31_27425 [Verrucomicrobia bacterium]|nr:hypothetical protein [Verrucomicrobiota bacterium]MBV8481272.1 hypothetical protein [Verrucomicrobiota bacterium]
MNTAPMDCLCLNRLRYLKISCCAGLIVLASVLGCAFSAFAALADVAANRIAEDATIKGKGKDGACMDYAIALSSKLAQNGIHGRLIFYRWHIRNTSITGSHVFVAYLIGDGNEWIVDNEIAAPKKVPLDATPMQLVFLLSGDPSAPVDVDLEDGLNRLSFF